jgi:UDP-N-acetylmuramoylalanine-D-glutamate ligase
LPAFTPRPPIPRGPFLVAGLGRAGQAAVQALSRRQAAGPPQIFAWDSDTNRQMRRLASRLERAGVSTWLGNPPNLGKDVRARTVLKSPGISFDVPLLEQARELGLEVLDELELGWRLSRAPMLAVTARRSRSTTSQARERPSGRWATRPNRRVS